MSQICVADYTSAAFLWVGGVACIFLGQFEASDPCNDAPDALRMKTIYAVLHAIAAILFVGLTSAAVIIIANGELWISAGLAIGGVFLFLLAVLAQNLTGNYVYSPNICVLPQRPEDRQNPDARYFVCHQWLNHFSHRIILSRLVLFAELAGIALIIFSVSNTKQQLI